MAKRRRTAEERERRAKMTSFLQDLNVSSVEDVQNLFKELIGNVLENGLEAEMDEELGYSKYDYRNKDTDNSRNGHSLKNLKTSDNGQWRQVNFQPAANAGQARPMSWPDPRHPATRC